MRISSKISEYLTIREWNEFEENYYKWKEETAFISYTGSKVNSKFYLNIYEKGMKSVPFVLFSMSKQADFWFELLDKILDEKPLFRPGDSGRIQLMTDRWLHFGIQANLIEFDNTDSNEFVNRISYTDINCSIDTNKYVKLFQNSDCR
jgi:hypothetical protein